MTCIRDILYFANTLKNNHISSDLFDEVASTFYKYKGFIMVFMFKEFTKHYANSIDKPEFLDQC